MTTTTLAPFEGTEVASVGLKIAGAGTGLSDALRVAPAQYAQGERLNLLLVVEVDKITYEQHDARDDDDHRLRRVHVIKPETATILADDVVADALQAHRDALKQLDGQRQLGDEDDENVTPLR